VGPTRIVRFEHLDEPSSLPAGTRVLPSILQPSLSITMIRATRSRVGDWIAGDAAKTREVVCRPSLSSRLRWPRRVGGGMSSAADVKGFSNRPRSIDSKNGVVVKGCTVAAPSAVQYRRIRTQYYLQCASNTYDEFVFGTEICGPSQFRNFSIGGCFAVLFTLHSSRNWLPSVYRL